jgi:alpha,alpha-trehalase
VTGRRAIRELPSALDRPGVVRERLGDRTPAVFLDYDGTLTPIVPDPAEARLPEATRRTLRRLARACPVAVLSGRDLPDVRSRVGLPGLHYAGSHGFDIRGPGGLREERATELLPALEAAAEALEAAASDVPGARVERKRFAVAVHWRATHSEDVPGLEERVREVGRDFPDLEVAGGKKIFELRPAVAWDKGRALERLMEVMDLDPGCACPVYVGDDVTDEDAFRFVREVEGLAVVVRGEDDDRATRAELALADPAAVRSFLEALAKGGGDGSV